MNKMKVYGRWKEEAWNSLEWKRNRAKILRIRNECEVCGSKERLSIHHPPRQTDRKTLFNEARDGFEKTQDVDPRHEMMAFVTWLNKTGERKQIKKASMPGTNHKEYIQMIDVVVLCKDCHDKVHHKGIYSHRERRLNESTPNSSQSDRSSKDVNGAERD